MHPWSFDAAVFARYFDTKSRSWATISAAIFTETRRRLTKGNLRQYVDKFANDNKAPLPFVFDPDGQLKAKIIADRDLGTQDWLQGIRPRSSWSAMVALLLPLLKLMIARKLDQIIEDMLQ